MDAGVDAIVRRFDEDRWLASRFAPAEVRARLIAIYALNHEIARTTEVVSTPQLVDVRLAWWREAIEEVYAGKVPRTHPVLTAFANVASHVTNRWSEVIETRRWDDAFSTWGSVDEFIERTARPIMHMALQASGVSDQQLGPLMPVMTHAALAWGHVGLARSTRFASRVPGPLRESLERAAAAYAQTKTASVVPLSAFPSIGYVALVPGYIRALRRGERETPLLARQLRLIGAVATGRL